MSKYKAEKVVLDGIRFDSKDEARYYLYLKKLKSESKIENFELQPKYELQPKFKKNAKSFLPVFYIADFLIYHLDGSLEVIDIKGMATETAKLKRKLFEYRYPDLNLSWLIRSLKYSETGWIDCDELKKIRRENKKCK
ncbi:DUF1064 domain-containing protein [Clostridium hydrogeniformans]|uniref:DUF1064 domain-containing protein n=1 Tax=Clostridium hydrogeniformans TaxID=349933 RepID=UPI000484FD1F|nr:DUF1064 domain-containing protein [Clostridium hydrogeniformans]